MEKPQDLVKKDKVLFYITFGIVLSFVLFNLKSVLSIVLDILALATPFYIAIVIAFIINLPMRKIEKGLWKLKKKADWKRLGKGAIRALSIAITMLILVVIVTLFSSFIIPKIGESIALIFSNLTNYAAKLSAFVTALCKQFHINYSLTTADVNKWFSSVDLNTALQTVGSFFGASASSATKIVNSVSGTALTSITAFIMALYLLGNKEKHITQMRKLVTYFFGFKRSSTIFEVAAEANHYFSSFVTGQVLEACCFMTLVYVFMRIFGLPFPELVALIAFLFSFIPMFGGFFSFTFGLILVAAAQSESLLLYIIMFVCLQQFEGNVVYPRVVGNAVGISGLFVLLGITIFGNLFGFFGVLIAVPLTALIYALASRIINITLYRRHIEVTYHHLEEIKEDE